jgi:hypothetical protein
MKNLTILGTVATFLALAILAAPASASAMCASDGRYMGDCPDTYPRSSYGYQYPSYYGYPTDCDPHYCDDYGPNYPYRYGSKYGYGSNYRQPQSMYFPVDQRFPSYTPAQYPQNQRSQYGYGYGRYESRNQSTVHGQYQNGNQNYGYGSGYTQAPVIYAPYNSGIGWYGGQNYSSTPAWMGCDPYAGMDYCY